MIFIRPKILRDASHTAIETDSKYNYIRDLQQGGPVPQMRGVERPVIPELEPQDYLPMPDQDEPTGQQN